MTNFKQQGFTLIEISIVFLIIAILLNFALTPLRTQYEIHNIKNTHKQLAEIELAIYGYAIANERLPCPTLPGKGGISQPAYLDSSITATAGTDSCEVNIGFLPAGTLGLKGRRNCDGLLTDSWGRAYRYSITNADASDNGDDFLVRGQLKAISNNGEGIANVKPDLLICNNLDVDCRDTPSASVVSTNRAVAVIFSLGTRQRLNSHAENENAGEGDAISSTCHLPDYAIGNDRYYYASSRREIEGKEFDDILIWISPNILYSKLLAAGVIP